MDNQNNSEQLQPNRSDARLLKSAQNQITFGYVAAPLSLFFGGMLLGTVSLVVVALAYRKLCLLEHKADSVAQTALKMKRSAKIAIVFSLVAILLNGISMYLMFPVILDMLQNGQITPALSNSDLGSSANSSTWG